MRTITVAITLLSGLVQATVVATAVAAGAQSAAAAGTVAPDRVGVVVAPSAAGAGEITEGPWVPGSLMTPLRAGQLVPSGSIVRNLAGQSFDLNAAIRRQPTILIFYRGGWCPYCNAHLHDLQGSEPALRAMGYQIFAVSSDPPGALRQTLTADHLNYTLLSDASLDVAAKFGLKYKVKPSVLEFLKRAHVDLVKQNGGYLLTPAAFVVDTRGVIRFAYSNTNYTVRVGQPALLAAARAALKRSTPADAP